jgi:hypothetical protein
LFGDPGGWGGKEIRTAGPPKVECFSEHAFSTAPGGKTVSRQIDSTERDRWFESVFLHRRVSELSVPERAPREFHCRRGYYDPVLIPLSQAMLLQINPPERHGHAMAVVENRGALRVC